MRWFWVRKLIYSIKNNIIIVEKTLFSSTVYTAVYVMYCVLYCVLYCTVYCTVYCVLYCTYFTEYCTEYVLYHVVLITGIILYMYSISWTELNWTVYYLYCNLGIIKVFVLLIYALYVFFTRCTLCTVI